MALALSTSVRSHETEANSEATSTPPEASAWVDPSLYGDGLYDFTCTQTPRSIDPGANDCPLDGNGQTMACCIWSDGAYEGRPVCTSWARELMYFRQVGKGLCCHSLPPGTAFRKFEKHDELCGFCAGKNPTNEECCTIDLEIVPAYPVRDPSVCPDLRQDPAHQPSVTDPPCGSEDMAKEGKKIPQSPTGAPFYIGCAAHDRCYSTCRAGKALCDENLKVQLAAICDDFFAPLLANANEVEADQIQMSWGYCKGFSWTYYQAVTRRGASAYESAQAKVCRCCIGGYDVPFPP